MRSAKECLAKADDMDVAALACAATADQYRLMAVSWRRLARQADWQDGFPHLSGPRLLTA